MEARTGKGGAKRRRQLHHLELRVYWFIIADDNHYLMVPVYMILQIQNTCICFRTPGTWHIAPGTEQHDPHDWHLASSPGQPSGFTLGADVTVAAGNIIIAALGIFKASSARPSLNQGMPVF